MLCGVFMMLFWVEGLIYLENIQLHQIYSIHHEEYYAFLKNNEKNGISRALSLRGRQQLFLGRRSVGLLET